MKSFCRAGAGLLFSVMGMLVVASVLSSCEREEPSEPANLGTEIRDMAVRAEPRLQGRNLRFTGNVIDGGDGVCACIEVCDANGENCTACVCDPVGCGTCNP